MNPTTTDKIESINRQMLEAGFRRDHLLTEDATEGQILEAKTRLFSAAAQRLTPNETPNRQSVIRQKVAEMFIRENSGGFVSKTFAKARDLMSAAAVANAAAEHEVQRVASLHEQFRALSEQLKHAAGDLSEARQTHEAAVGAMEELDRDENVVARYVMHHRSGIPTSVRVLDIEGGRNALAMVIQDWPRVERILSERVTALQAKVDEIKPQLIESVEGV